MEYVTSADGTRIAFERTGSGPPLVLVHGSINDRRIWSLVRAAFDERFTVYAMDRRGRNESGLPAEHDMARQFEDVAAVIAAAGEPVDLMGHSFGAHCALGAAALMPDRIKHLVLYEPPTPDASRMALSEEFETDPEDALARFLAFIGVTPAEIAERRASPVWQWFLSFTSSMPSEGRALVNYGFDASRFASLTMPALFLLGSITADRLGEVLRKLAATTMPQAEWFTFEGHGHGAMASAPKLFSDTVIEFLLR